MKKIILVFYMLVLVMMFTIASAASFQDNISICNKSDRGTTESFVHIVNLPSSVEVIEDEAFEGTALSNISLPETVTTIGERAFANIRTLLSIRIPISATSIAKTAFIGSDHVTITAAPNSYARTWAKENRMPFSPITVMYAGKDFQSVTGSLSSSSKEILDKDSSETQDIYRTWRKLEEINTCDTIEIIENVIQGRAPPMA